MPTDRLAHRIDGRSKSYSQDSPTVSADVLARRSQSAFVDQRSGRADEHCGKVETANILRTSSRHFSVMFKHCI